MDAEPNGEARGLTRRMRTRSRRTGWTVLWAIVLVFLFGLIASRRSGDETIVEGYIYRGLNDHTGDYYSPVAGALITNDRNTSAFVTDATGHFRLVLPRLGGGEYAIVTVWQGGTVVLRQPIGTEISI